MICRGCEGGKAMLKNGHVVYSNCEHCDAMLALKDGEYEHYGKIIKITGRKLGFIDNIESAYKLCSCFASNHKNGIIPVSEKFMKVNEDVKEHNKQEEDTRQDSINMYEQGKLEEIEKYQEQLIEAKRKDEENPEWILDHHFDDDGNPIE